MEAIVGCGVREFCVHVVAGGRERLLRRGGGDGDYVAGALEVNGSRKDEGCFESVEFMLEGVDCAECAVGAVEGLNFSGGFVASLGVGEWG